MLEPKRSMIEDHITSLNQEQLLNELVSNRDVKGLSNFISNRVSNKKFKEALAQREIYRHELDKLQFAYDITKGNVSGPNGRKVGSRVEIRESSLAYRDVHEKFAYIQERLNEYRRITAMAADKYGAVRLEEDSKSGAIKIFEKKTLGDLKSTGYFESGSQEWLDNRTTGVGGSDVGPILRVGDVKYRSGNLRDIKLSKLGQAVEQKPQNDDPYMTAIGRGNAWEDTILHMFADNNPELQLAHCKLSWEAVENPHRKANFDGLIVDKNNKAIGILEIKTSSNAADWGPVEGGLDSVPAGYKTQILWYAANAKLKFGKIIALIDDHDYREYSFEIDEKLEKEISEMFEATDLFWSNIEQEKRESKRRVALTRKRSLGSIHDFKHVSKIAELYNGSNIKASNIDRLKKYNLSSLEEYEELFEDEIRTIIADMFSKSDPSESTEEFYGIDLETTSASPRKGRIIEAGVVMQKALDDPVILHNSLHSVPDIVVDGPGIGFEEVHGLNAESLKGRKSFDDPEIQKEILELLLKGTIVAHNAGFEDRFLTVNLKGYAEAVDAGKIKLLDTRVLTSYLMPEAEDNSLNSFAEDNGVPYEGAHSATVDSLMMMKGFRNLRENIFKNRGVFIPQIFTDKDRENAKQEAIKIDMFR